MAESQTEDVPRTPEDPSTDHVLAAMEPCVPYTVSDLQSEFSDASRWTIQRRLDSLVDDGAIEKKKHTENRVSYWKPE